MREIKFRALVIDPSLASRWEYYTTLSLPTWADEPKIVKDLQYTGLKDKNGKGAEVYHKDIFANGETVEWERGCWIVKVPGRGYTVLLAEFLENDPGRTVVGNAYENPELLK